MTRMVNGNLVRSACAALDAIDEEAAADLVRITQKIVVNGYRRCRCSTLDSNRNAEAESCIQRKMHFLYGFLNGIESLMVRRRSERSLWYAADGLNMLSDLG